MKITALGVDEMAAEILRNVTMRLQALGEFALEPEGREADEIDKVNAKERIRLAWQSYDLDVEDEAALDLVRAEMKKWWQDCAEQHLLSELFQRAERRRKENRIV